MALAFGIFLVAAGVSIIGIGLATMRYDATKSARRAAQPACFEIVDGLDPRANVNNAYSGNPGFEKFKVPCVPNHLTGGVK